MAGRPWTRARCIAALGVMAAASLAFGVTAVSADSAELRYKAAPGEANALTLVLDSTDLVLTDTGATALPSSLKGCTEVPVTTGVSARCPAPGKLLFHLDLGDGNDHILGDMLLPRITLDVNAGDGDDIVEPGDGDDYIAGGPGLDTLYGGYGNDTVIGQEGDDWLRGSPGSDVIDGGAGFDFIVGDSGADQLFGGGDIDFILAGAGADFVDGGGDFDAIDGEGGDDTLRGGAGDDDLKGGGGSDVVDGEGGDDILRARDGEPDSLTCGAGNDVAKVDAGALDSVNRSCEKVRVDAD